MLACTKPPCPPVSRQADDLQQELDACQHLVGRYKTRMAAAQDEASGLEEGLQRERAETRRLRQQLELLQQEVHGQRLLLQQQQQQQQMAQEQSKLLQADHVRAAAAASAASLLTTPTAGPKVSGHGGASAGVSEAPGHAALAAEVEARTEQLRKLQQQVGMDVGADCPCLESLSWTAICIPAAMAC